MQKTMIASFLLGELERANRIHGVNFISAHEGYAVLLEELDELWAEVKKKHPSKDRMREEAIQLGAMAIKFIMSMTSWTSIDVCSRCLYAVMTVEELAKFEIDPCDQCDSDLSMATKKESGK